MTCIGGLLNTVTGSVILTADEVKEVEGHIDQLNAENARLRSCLSDDAENAKLIMAENAKLREFAEMMLLVCKNQGIAGGVFTQLGSNSNLEERVDFESRARELGIEVPS